LRRLLYPGFLLLGLSLPLSKSASTVLLGVLLASALACLSRSREFRGEIRRAAPQPLTPALAIFCLVAYAGILHTEKFSDGFSVANKFVTLPIIYFFVSVFLQSEPGEEARDWRAAGLLFSFLAGLAALDAIALASLPGAAGAPKGALPLSPLGMHHIWFSNVNALGSYTALAFLLCARPWGISARARAALWGFLLLSLLCIVLSLSRTAWFGLALTSAILAGVAIRRRMTMVVAAVLFVLAFALAYTFVPLVHDRLKLIAEETALFFTDQNIRSSVGDRFLMWKAALRMFLEAPLIGAGTGDYSRVIAAWHDAGIVPAALLEFNQPHNIYLFSMATNGLAGLAALLFIFSRSLATAAPAMRSGGRERLFAVLGMATAVHFMVAGFLDSFFNIQVLRYSFAFIMGVCIRGSSIGRDRA
jgi:O-antigen ligase